MKVRVGNFSVSLDGFGAGPEQSLENPLGKRGLELHQWLFGTRTFQAMTGKDGGSDGIDEDYAHRSMVGCGAWVLGRNMFGPIRGPWPDASWKGWWGDNPPFHVPTFVLTHHRRDPIEMEGGTTFVFVTEGIEAALDQAKRAANGRDVMIGGGVGTVRQYLLAGLIDELHFALTPVVLGCGEALFTGIDLPALGYRVAEHHATEHATHIVLLRHPPDRATESDCAPPEPRFVTGSNGRQSRFLEFHFQVKGYARPGPSVANPQTLVGCPQEACSRGSQTTGAAISDSSPHQSAASSSHQGTS